MCLILPRELDSIYKARRGYKIADKDIIAWKVVYHKKNGFYKSIVQNFDYREGVNYSSKINISCLSRQFIIYKGLHSYTSRSIARESSSNWLETVIKVIIPKGARYWTNSSGSEYVSDKLYIPKQR